MYVQFNFWLCFTMRSKANFDFSPEWIKYMLCYPLRLESLWLWCCCLKSTAGCYSGNLSDGGVDNIQKSTFGHLDCGNTLTAEICYIKHISIQYGRNPSDNSATVIRHLSPTIVIRISLLIMMMMIVVMMRVRERASERERLVSYSWCFEPSQPQRITSGLTHCSTLHYQLDKQPAQVTAGIICYSYFLYAATSNLSVTATSIACVHRKTPYHQLHPHPHPASTVTVLTPCIISE